MFFCRHVCKYVCICISTCICIYIMYICVWLYMYMYTCIYVYVYMCMCILYIYIRTAIRLEPTQFISAGLTFHLRFPAFSTCCAPRSWGYMGLPLFQARPDAQGLMRFPSSKCPGRQKKGDPKGYIFWGSTTNNLERAPKKGGPRKK